MSDAADRLKCEERARASRVQRVLELLNQAEAPEELIIATGSRSPADSELIQSALASRARVGEFASLRGLADALGGPEPALRLLELLADDEQLVPCEATGDWTASILPWIHGGEATMSGVPHAFKLDFTPTAVNGFVRLRCSDDVITVLDDRAWTGGKDIELPADLKKKRNDILAHPFFDTDYFQVEDTKWKVSAHGGTCIEIALGANFRMKPNIYQEVQGAGSIDGRQMAEDWLVRAIAAFRVCCCTAEAPKDNAPKCSWSARRIDFHTTTLAGSPPKFGGPEFSWRLDADLGRCGEVKKRTKIGPFV